MRSAFILLTLIAAGCGATGSDLRVDYRDVIVDVDAKGTARVVVAVHDRRESVLKDGEGADFVGRSRVAAGIPAAVTTSTGHALADDVAAAISNSLKLKGFACEVVKTRSTEDEVAVRGKLLEKDADKIVLFTMKTWETYTLARTELRVDVELAVLDGKGNRLALESLKETPVVAGDPLNIPDVSQRAYRQRLEQLLNKPAIRAALEASPAPSVD